MVKKTFIKLIRIIPISLFVLHMFLPVMVVDARTLKDEIKELDRLLEEAKNVENKIKYTTAQMQEAQRNINQIVIDIDNIVKEVDKTSEEIKNLTTDIINKQEEIKKLVAFTQLSNGESIYIDYIAGAQSMEDFIYRISVAEQLLEYNDQLITDMNNKIEENNQKKVKLQEQNELAKQKQQDYIRNLAILGQDKKRLTEEDLSLEQEIKNAKEMIDLYIAAGCKETDSINVCASKILPIDTKFWRPMEKGCVTSNYSSSRYHPIDNEYKAHYGVDLSNTDRYNTLVYAAAKGKVVAAEYDKGGNIGYYVAIHHNIGGKLYTTRYLHLKAGSIRVKPGDIVTKDTVLAIMGSTGKSTGEHLHFEVAECLIGNPDCILNFEKYYAKTIDPRTVVNLPQNNYTYWLNRTNYVW